MKSLPALHPLLILPICASVLLLAAGAARAQNLYVADWDSPGAVYVYAPGSQTHTTFFSGNTSYLGEPEEIAFDSHGNLFLDDSASGSVDEITSSGNESTLALLAVGPWGFSSGDVKKV